MTNIFGNYFIANIFDTGGELIERKTIKYTFTRPKITHFEWNGGEYIVPDSSFMFKISPFPYFFDYWVCSYEFNNPIPIKQVHLQKPQIPASYFHIILKNTELKKLIGVRNDWRNLLTPQNIMIGLAVVGVLIFLATGGSFSGLLNSFKVGSGTA